MAGKIFMLEANAIGARRAWVAATVDELWEEACKHGEVERIEPMLDGDRS